MHGQRLLSTISISIHISISISIIIISVLCCLTQSARHAVGASLQTVEQLQKHNIEVLRERLEHGWLAFCDAPVDEGIMSLHNGINPSDATLRLLTVNNQSIELPIKKLSELRDFEINKRRKTLLYVNAFHTTDTYFGVQAHLSLLQQTRRDLNIIIVDFSHTVEQLYYTVRHHVGVQSYVVYTLIKLLVAQGVHVKDLTLAGHSVGANIAARGARLYAKEQGQPIGQLIAIDPAVMCQQADISVHPDAADRVVVLHGEGDVFGVRAPLGHIDIYPNGIGYFPRRKLQPGCETKLCSHMYSFVLFMEALIEAVMIPAVKCDSWAKFRQQQCDYKNTLALGLNYPSTAKGIYFCVTQPNPPFTYMEHGLRYTQKKKLTKA